VSSTAVAGSLPFGLVLGWCLAKRQFWGKFAVETLINLPLVLPPVVTGYLLLVLFGRHWLGGPLESWLGLRLIFTWKGAALAAAVVGFPLMVRPIRLAFAGVDDRLVQAARTLGAGRLDAFWSITFPLARNGIVGGCVLALARGMGEFGATLMIAGNTAGKTRTIPLAIYSALNEPGGPERSWRLLLVSVLIAAAALFVGEYLERRGRRQLTGQ
jgi:molybdate transport system permease protein